jgi:hypothetical protein
MLYKLTISDKDIQPQAFLDLASLQKLEKDLEVLLAKNLLEVLFEDARLMPIFQERALQPEADLYALDRAGDLVIFELKKGLAGPEAMHQALRYGQDAGQWTFDKLEKKYRTYSGNPSASLCDAHKEAFDLERPLLPIEFNKKQHFQIVGHAANDRLIEAVDYWRRQVYLSISYLTVSTTSMGSITLNFSHAPMIVTRIHLR